MQKKFFHNHMPDNENLKIQKTSPVINISKKNRVDINKLLNRVKIDKQNQNKKKIIFLSFGILLIGLMGIFITLV
jgi:hypothetical protein